MKLLLQMAAAVVLLLPPLADARDWGAGRGAMFQAQAQHMKKKESGRFERGERDKRGEHDKRREGRLTREERRELHRDLDRANREIYQR